MTIDGSKFRDLQEALLATYHDRRRLEEMVRFNLDLNLDEVTSEDDLRSTVFDLIKWADGEGRVAELITAAHDPEKPGTRIASIYSQLPGWLAGRVSESSQMLATPEVPTASTEPAVQQRSATPPNHPDVVADLEIGIERGPDAYAVELRLALADGEAELRTKADGLNISMDELDMFALDSLAYGRHLGQEVFKVKIVPEVFAMARALEGPLRVRLFIDPSAAELDAIRWETLIDPGAPEPLAPLIMGERIRFSRYVSSTDWRRVPPPHKSDVRALVVVASPSNLSEYALVPLDAATEFANARASLAGIPVTTCGETDRASLRNIIDKLREDLDIFYLVCHGALIEGQQRL
jgi:hypothetical protein